MTEFISSNLQTNLNKCATEEVENQNQNISENLASAADKQENQNQQKSKNQTQNYKIDSKISKDRLHQKNLQNLIKRVDSASRAYYAAERAAKNFEIEKDLADQIFKESLIYHHRENRNGDQQRFSRENTPNSVEVPSTYIDFNPTYQNSAIFSNNNSKKIKETALDRNGSVIRVINLSKSNSTASQKNRLINHQNRLNFSSINSEELAHHINLGGPENCISQTTSCISDSVAAPKYVSIKKKLKRMDASRPLEMDQVARTLSLTASRKNSDVANNNNSGNESHPLSFFGHLSRKNSNQKAGRNKNNRSYGHQYSPNLSNFSSNCSYNLRTKSLKENAEPSRGISVSPSRRANNNNNNNNFREKSRSLQHHTTNAHNSRSQSLHGNRLKTPGAIMMTQARERRDSNRRQMNYNPHHQSVKTPNNKTEKPRKPGKITQKNSPIYDIPKNQSNKKTTKSIINEQNNHFHNKSPIVSRGPSISSTLNFHNHSSKNSMGRSVSSGHLKEIGVGFDNYFDRP